MTQHNDGEGHQITQNGDVIVCHGISHCPLAHQEPESKRQAEFADATGIWCPKEARDVFEHLMAAHSFTAKELGRAWESTVKWDRRSRELRVSTPWADLIAGYSLFGFSLTFFVLQALSVLFGPPVPSKHDLLATALLGGIYFGACWLIARFIMTPRRVALRMRDVLPAMKRSDLHEIDEGGRHE
jgi:hypothetical protein